MANPKPTPPTFSFTSHPSLQPFTTTTKSYLSDCSQSPSPVPFGYIGTGALVLTTPPNHPNTLHILLVQRAPTDSMPNCWEVPGGACDDTDSSILHGAARELWEETGLVAKNFTAVVGEPHVFLTRSEKVVGKFHFMVDVEGSEDGRGLVKLDPEEHQAFFWATEEDVRSGKKGDVRLEFTSGELERVVLQVFEMLRCKDVNQGVSEG